MVLFNFDWMEENDNLVLFLSSQPSIWSGIMQSTFKGPRQQHNTNPTLRVNVTFFFFFPMIFLRFIHIYTFANTPLELPLILLFPILFKFLGLPSRFHLIDIFTFFLEREGEITCSLYILLRDDH